MSIMLDYLHSNTISFVQKMDRKSECGLLSRTNRHFYTRRKKQPDDMSEIKLGKVLKSLISKNSTCRESKAKKLTQMHQDQSKSKIHDKYFEIQDSKRELLMNIKKEHPIFGKLLNSFEKCISSQSIQQMQSYQFIFYQLLNQVVLFSLERAKAQQVLCSEPKSKVIKQNALYLQNMKLEKQNIMLRNQINYGIQDNQKREMPVLSDSVTKSRTVKYIECIKNPTAANQEFITNMVMMERKLQVASQEIEIMKREIESLKQELFLIKDEKKSLKQRILELKVKNENLCSEIIGLQLKNKKMGVSDDRRQAIILMQYQEIDSYRYQIWELKKLYLSLSTKYKSLIVKFKKTVSDGSKIGAINSRQTHLFPEQLQAFEQVRGMVQFSNKIHMVGGKDKKMERNPLYQEFLGAKETMNNKQGVKKISRMGLQYYYPSFYALIAQEINLLGIDQNNFQHFNQGIRLNFIGTVRAILDSKFNEFILNRNNGLVSSFPSFVLAWLTTYQVGETKRVEIITNSNSMSNKEVICTFYINLMSSKLNSSWEMIAFRQFLLETFLNDELYFYLNLRYLLLGGDITNDLSFCFQQIYYVDFNRCFTFLSKVIKQQSREVYEEFLKRASVTIRKKSYLDLHYVLRIMLEYYQNLKQKQIESILKTLEMLVDNSKQNVGLSEFLKIFDYHFVFLSLTEKIELYRKCFCIGSGSVTAQTILAVLNQENVFLRWVETIINNTPIRVEQVKGIEDDNSFIVIPNIDWIYESQKVFRFILNSQFLRETQLFGIQALLNDTKNLTKLTSHSIHTRLEMCFSACMMVSKKLYYSGLVNNHQLSQVIKLTSDFMASLSKVTLRKNQIMQIMRYLKQKTAVQKITNFFHKKKAEMTRSILYAYSSNGLAESVEEKTEVLRTQFLQIIEQAKVKKKSDSRVNIEQI